ncbi:MAG TPA: RcnB family protein [Xanthobacteraceae bacterium]|nr:RcnB family protein [Xanthobacteraceae bacterium]
MRRSFAIAAIFALVLPALAAAQEHHDEQHKGPPGAHPGGPPHPPPHPMGPPPGQPHPQFKQIGPQHGQMGGPPHPPGQMGGPPHPPGPPAAFVHPGGPPGAQFSYHGHEFNRFHARHEFVYPPGWSYRRWGVGAILPPLFLAPDYYFMDWADLGLPPPPPGDQWVRYGPDLLLVDVRSGAIVDVIYDAFY